MGIGGVNKSFRNRRMNRGIGREQQDELVQVIVNANMNKTDEKKLKSVGRVIHRLPMIQAYVLEIPQIALDDLKGVEGVAKVEYDTRMTAQMDVARKTINVENVINKGRLTGKGVTVAVVDTGVYPHADFLVPYNRLLKQVDYVGNLDAPYDDNGHGTHVAGIIGSNGISSDGKYMGIAPDVNLLSVKVLNKKGGGKTSDVLAGLQWVMDNRNKYNIRIVNISIGGDDHKGEESSIVKAVDHLWDNGIVIVTAAGNKGPRSRTITTPGISRKIITVGCSNDHETVNINGDYISNYSSRGPTRACIIKPDVVAPGANIISCASKENYKPMERLSREDSKYESKSGTSMAAPIVSGATALLLQSNPYLTPNEVKLKLSQCCDDLGFKKNHQGWGRINIDKLTSR